MAEKNFMQKNTSGLPLVSCIMPTRNRPEYLAQAIALFLRQTYENKELVIVDDSDANHQDCLGTADNRVRYFHLASKLNLGEKRNYACNVAQGEFIAHWDDDDWYSPLRVHYQVQPLLAGEADITSFSDCVFLDLGTDKFWTCSESLFRKMFMGNVHGGTLAYTRDILRKGVRYPHVFLAEDAFFLHRTYMAKTVLKPLPSNGHFVYVRHEKSTWGFKCGSHLHPSGWTCLPERPSFMPAGDLATLQAISKSAT